MDVYILKRHGQDMSQMQSAQRLNRLNYRALISRPK